MASKNVIKFNTILKRSQCLNSLQESASIDSNRLYENVKTYCERAKTGKEIGFQNVLKSFIEGMCDCTNADKYYWQPLDLLKEFNEREFDSTVSSKFLHEYVTRILPYTGDLQSVSECLNRYELPEYEADSINEAITMISVADRITKNHNNLSNRFNLDRSIIKYNASGLKYFIDSCADMIDTYNVPDYQKMNITLEESVYLLEKNGIKENKSDIVKCVVEYYLTKTPYISETNIDNFKKVLTKSYVLEESDLSKINYLFESVAGNSIESGINAFLMNGSKTPELLSETISKILESTSSEDIVYNSDKIPMMLWDLAKNKVFESDEAIYKCNTIISDYIAEIAKLDSGILDKNFVKEDVLNIIESFNNDLEIIRSAGSANAEYSEAANNFIRKGLNPCIESLTEVSQLLYCKANIDALRYVNEDAEVVPLNEFKLFKFHNLVNAAFHLDKFLKVKEKKFYTNAKIKINSLAKKAKNILFGEAAEVENNIMDYIGEDCKADICVRQYPYTDKELSSVIEYAEAVCSEYNDMLLAQDETCRAYYIINPGLAEIRIKESTTVGLEDINEVYKHLDPAMDTYLEYFGMADTISKTYEGVSVNSIEDNISKLSNCTQFTLEQFSMVLEALSILGVDKNVVESFGESYISYNFDHTVESGAINESYMTLAKEEREINALVEDWEAIEDADYESMLEALDYLQMIFEYSYPDDEDEDDDDEDEDDEEETKSSSKPEVKKVAVGPAGAAKSSKDNDKKDTKKKEPESVDDIKIPKPAKGKLYKGSINLNSIKLGLMGLKTKFKDMDTKQKEASRNMDNASRAFAKAVKDSLVSDRREAIIKGSLIPSFSRCMKNAIILAGIAYFSLPLALITAIGGLALSAKLTHNERLLLLDEIDTELEVVDKELAIADSNNNIKKYRALLQYKKDLQRQYQRIRYNIRVGKDILPGSAAGRPLNAD